jgi:hypothetical protein
MSRRKGKKGVEGGKEAATQGREAGKCVLAMAQEPVPVPRSMIFWGDSPMGAKYRFPLRTGFSDV